MAEEESTTETTAPKGTQSLTKDQLIEAIKQMSVLELSELVKALEEEFGVSAAAPAAPAAAVPAAGAPAEEESAEEEQTEFTVTLQSYGENKINVIRAVREVSSLGLKEAKELVEGAPKPVVEAVSKEVATTAKQKLEEAGATVEMK